MWKLANLAEVGRVITKLTNTNHMLPAAYLPAGLFTTKQLSQKVFELPLFAVLHL